MSSVGGQTIAGRRVCVTGGTGALGSVIASAFQRAGARVAVTRSASASNSRQSDPHLFEIQCDVTDPRSVDELFQALTKEWKGIDILVNTVGGFGSGTVAETSPDAWQRLLTLNLTSAFLLTKGAHQTMAGNGWGRIIHIAALTGLAPAPGKVAYGLSKAGIVYLVQTAGLELSGTGITVNAIAPEIIDTPQNREAMPDVDPTNWVKREDIASAILALCDSSHDHVTGTTLRMPSGIGNVT